MLGYSVWSVSFSSQGLLASGLDDRTVKIWNVITDERSRSLNGHDTATTISKLDMKSSSEYEYYMYESSITSPNFNT